jgi:GT2 family glycosyltransferase
MAARAARGRQGRAKRQVRAKQVRPRCVAWFTDRALVLVGPFEGLNGQRIEGSAELDGRRVAVAARGASYPIASEGEEESTLGVLVGRIPERSSSSSALERIRLSWDEARLTASKRDLAAVATDPTTLAREELASLEAEARTSLLQFLAEWVAGDDVPASQTLSRELHRVREALRERLPICTLSEREPQGLALEEILGADDRCFWVKGWFRDEDSRARPTLVSPEGSRSDLREDAFRDTRPDVQRFYANLGDEEARTNHGFITHVELPAPSRLATGWIAELRNTFGATVEAAGPEVIRDPERVRDAIFRDLAVERPLGGPLTTNHAYPVLSRLQDRLSNAVRIEEVIEYGGKPRSPKVSMIVPLYGRVDFLEHQLFHFSKDPELARADLIYVLDSPELRDSVVNSAQQLLALHGVPFRLVILSRNGGFARANNAGASVARGSLLLLLNSDVLPHRPGWIGKMRECYEQTSDIGALAPKLLYEDDSLQHAGLYFHRAPGMEVWENAHCFKGAHRSFPPADVSRRVPAVTAACMMIDRSLYEQLDGLPGHYVRGDYEDSDLCMRLTELGRQNWYLADVELYHLEGQSYAAGERRLASEYNRWLHTHRWGKLIEEVMAEFDPHAVSGDPGFS